MTFKYREHRGSLASSMKTCVTLDSKQALIDHIHSTLDFTPKVDAITIEPYRYDDRNHWYTHIVTLKDYGVLGFTNGPV